MHPQNYFKDVIVDDQPATRWRKISWEHKCGEGRNGRIPPHICFGAFTKVIH